MRRDLMTALALLGIPLASTQVWALDPSPPGTAATVAVKLTVRDESKGDWHSESVNRVMDAQCVMRASQSSQIGSGGMSAEQQAAAAQVQANTEVFAQAYGPSDDMMAQMEAGAAQCGDDEACMMAFVMKMSQTPEMQAMAQKMPEAQAAAGALVPDLGPARYQMWFPESCTGSLTVNDTYVDSDPGGEGGDGAYTDNITATGTAALHPAWKGLVMEADLATNTTTYTVVAPPPVTIQAQSTRQGAYAREIPFLASAALPEKIGPIPGIGAGSTEIKGATGTLLAEWSTIK